MAEPPITFAALLRKLRIDAGLTQEALAEAAGISPRSVSDLERGINLTARRDTTRLLADALGLSGAPRAEFEAVARGRTLTSQPETGGILPATRTLPRDIASFTGRAPELRMLTDAAAASRGAGGVVGIHAIGGMAGIGKTTFAVHVAHRLAPRFPDGQIFLQLHGHTPGRQPVDPADALASLLQVAGVTVQQIPPGLMARTALWRDRLADKHLLLVLDDAVDSEQVRPLLPGTTGSLVLVTSRRHLTALEDATAISLDTLPVDEAASLLIRLVARPGLTADDPAVAELSQLCGYLPLALGMVARQLHHHPAWTPADLAADLSAARDRLELMATENLSVTAAFNLSYADLSPGQHRMFRRLGLHPGTDVDEYAAAALDDTDLRTARRHLEALYDHYLLTEPAHGRYRLHDLIHEHARALAVTDSPTGTGSAVNRLFSYYRHTAEAADRHLTRHTRVAATVLVAADRPAAIPDLPDSTRALSWSRTERANLLACLDQVSREGASRATDDPWVIALTAAMASLLRQDGPWSDGIERHACAAAAARRLGDRLSEASALNDLGILRYLTGDYQIAAEALETALTIYRDLGNPLGQANSLYSLGSTLRRMADYAGAAQALENALGIYRDLGDRRGEAGALNDLGIVCYQTGDFSRADAALDQSLSIYRDISDRQGQASVLSDLGATRWRTGQYEAATAALDAALRVYREVGDLLGQSNALNGLGIVSLLTSDYAHAIGALEEAIRISGDIGYRLGQGDGYGFLGEARRRTGDYAAATEALEAALRISVGLGDGQGEASWLFQLSIVRCLTQDFPGALEAGQRSLQLYRDLGNRHGQAESLSCLGVLRRVTADYAGASDDLAASLAIYRDLGLRGGEVEVLNEIGILHLVRGEIGEAEACHRQALDLARELGSPHNEANALFGLGHCSLAADHVVEAEDSLCQAQEIYRRIGAAEASAVSAELDALRDAPEPTPADPQELWVTRERPAGTGVRCRGRGEFPGHARRPGIRSAGRSSGPRAAPLRLRHAGRPGEDTVRCLLERGLHRAARRCPQRSRGLCHDRRERRPDQRTPAIAHPSR